ncbi:MAG TPA: enolase C-terminal domain-like protein [Beijerinckiaceae bacterium]|nr:enolase C-terminal domain-like protein [Beijerinckiaceae bacterium]
MKIVRAEVLPCDMPQSDPQWRFSIHANRISKGWLFAATGADGTTGYGYASATRHMGASSEGLKGILEDFARLVRGRDAFDIVAILADLDHHLKGANQAKAAIDCALHELAARSLGIPLYQLLGGKLRDEFPVMRVLSLKAPDEMAERGRALVAAGYRHIKIKVDGAVALDTARVKAIRAAVGADIHLIIDANQAYRPKDAISLAEKVADEGVEIFEQPCAAEDHAGLKLVTQNSPIAIEADESAGSLRDVMMLVSNRVVDMVSLKVPKLGGVRNTLAAARICEINDIPCRLGAHVGPRLLTAQAMHVAAALPALSFACEFGEFVRLKNDITEGVENENGSIRLPGGIGSGAGLRADAAEQIAAAALAE